MATRKRLTEAERDEAYARDIVKAASLLGRWLKDVPREKFDADEILQNAVIRQIGIVGEAAASLSTNFKQKHSSVPWRAIVGMRQVVVHVYWTIDLDIVWPAATEDALQVGDYLATLFPSA